MKMPLDCVKAVNIFLDVFVCRRDFRICRRRGVRDSEMNSPFPRRHVFVRMRASLSDPQADKPSSTRIIRTWGGGGGGGRVAATPRHLAPE